VLLVSRAAIEFKRRIVSPVHFEMDGIHAYLACLFFDERNGLAAITAAAMGRIDVQFVNERIMAVELEAEAHGQHNVADRDDFFAKEPDSTECGKR
jgi:hypothetical protein